MRPSVTGPACVLLLAFALACERDVGAAPAPRPDEAAFAIGEEWRDLEPNTPRILAERDATRTPGLVTLWHPNGSKAGEGAYADDVKTGAWTFWYESGTLRWEGSFVDGVPHGAERGWYENGRQHFEFTREHGQRTGTCRWWHSDGTPALEAQFADDQLHGPCRRWTIDGQLDAPSSGVYEHGRKVAEL